MHEYGEDSEEAIKADVLGLQACTVKDTRVLPVLKSWSALFKKGKNEKQLNLETKAFPVRRTAQVDNETHKDKASDQ